MTLCTRSRYEDLRYATWRHVAKWCKGKKDCKYDYGIKDDQKVVPQELQHASMDGLYISTKFRVRIGTPSMIDVIIACASL